MSFILNPLFATVSEIMPELKQLELTAKNNAELWKTYEETEQFRKVYVRKTSAERLAVTEAEKAKELDDDEDCTVEPPQI